MDDLNKLQVIARQQKVIRRQQRILLSFGETAAAVELISSSSRDPFGKLRCAAGREQWSSSSSGGKVGEDGEGGGESTTGDSAMDEAWEEVEEEEEEEEKRRGTDAEENSDSFVTISDASFTDSEVSTRGEWSEVPKIKHEEECEVKAGESCCFKANPYFDSDQSGEDAMSGKEGSLEVTKAKDIDRQGDTRVMIGDPEELVEEVRESCLPDTNFPAINCLPRPVRMFRRSMGRSGGLGGLSRSKSENNLKDLKEEKPSSLFGSSFKNLWKKKEEEVKVMEISSPMLNRRPMILKTGQESLGESLNFSSMTDLRRDPEQRAFFHRPIFSCFLGNKEREWTQEERSMPNHKTMTRPRDVKRRQRRTQTLLQDSYQLNYSIC